MLPFGDGDNRLSGWLGPDESFEASLWRGCALSRPAGHVEDNDRSRHPPTQRDGDGDGDDDARKSRDARRPENGVRPIHRPSSLPPDRQTLCPFLCPPYAYALLRLSTFDPHMPYPPCITHAHMYPYTSSFGGFGSLVCRLPPVRLRSSSPPSSAIAPLRISAHTRAYIYTPSTRPIVVANPCISPTSVSILERSR